MQPLKIKRRERDTIIQALRAGVVPRLGLTHIQVGRAKEIEVLVRDIERIGEGGGLRYDSSSANTVLVRLFS